MKAESVNSKKKGKLLLLAILAGCSTVIGFQPVMAQPTLVNGTVTEDMVTTKDGIAADITGKAATITVGPVSGKDETHPIIGDPSSKDYYKYYAVRGTWAGSDSLSDLSVSGGKAIIHSGTMGDVDGSAAVLNAGGSATVSDSSVEITEGDIDQSEYGGVFGGLASVNASGDATISHSTANNSTVSISGGDISATVAGGCGYANSMNGKSDILAEADNNTTNITGGTFSGMAVYGGYGYAFSNEGEEKVTAITNNNQLSFNHDGYRGSGKGGYATATTYNGQVLAKANGNTLSIESGTFGDAFGGDSSAMTNGTDASTNNSAYAEANENKVTMNGGKVSTLWGASAMADTSNNIGSASGKANNNVLTIKGGTIDDSAYYGINGAVTMVTVAGSTAKGEAESSGNTVTIENGTINNRVSGSFSNASTWAESESLTSSSNDNRVTLKSGSVKGIRGGWALADAGYGTGNVSGNAKSNTVSIESGTVDGNVTGAFVSASTGSGTAEVTATGNRIRYTGGTISGASYVAGSLVNISGTEGTKITAEENEIHLDGNGVLPAADIYAVLFADSDGNASQPPENLTGGINNNRIYVSGDVDLSQASLHGIQKSQGVQHSGNTLYLGYTGESEKQWTKNTVKQVDGFDSIALFQSRWGTPTLSVTDKMDLSDTVIDASKLSFVNSSSVVPGASSVLIDNGSNEISDSAVSGIIQPENLSFDYTLAGKEDSAALSGSYGGKVSISSGKIVYKADDTVKVQKISLPETLDMTTSDSLITLEPYSYDFKGASLQGISNISFGTQEKTHILPYVGEGVTLIDGTKAASLESADSIATESRDYTYETDDHAVLATGKAASTIEGAKLKFQVSSIDQISYRNITSADSPVLRLKEGTSYDLGSTTLDTSGMSITPSALNSMISSNKGKLVLLDAGGNETNLSISPEARTFSVGTAFVGEGSVSSEKGNVVLGISDTQLASYLKASSQTHQVLIAREAELAALHAGDERLDDALRLLPEQKDGIQVLASFGRSYDRYETGSSAAEHVWNGLVGMSSSNTLSGGQVDYGLFYELGKGNYSTYDGSFHGSGDIKYHGGGLFARYNRNNTYAEVGLHLGRIKNEADKVLRDSNGTPYSYRTDSSYFSGSLEIGHTRHLEGRNMDWYGKYIHSTIGSDSFTDQDGVSYDIDSIHSDLLRAGLRFRETRNGWTYYYGAAYEYEFSGKAKGTVSYGNLSAPIESASVKGSSLFLEVGAQTGGSDENPWSLGFDGKAWAGQHRGFTGSINVGYHF